MENDSIISVNINVTNLDDALKKLKSASSEISNIDKSLKKSETLPKQIRTVSKTRSVTKISKDRQEFKKQFREEQKQKEFKKKLKTTQTLHDKVQSRIRRIEQIRESTAKKEILKQEKENARRQREIQREQERIQREEQRANRQKKQSGILNKPLSSFNVKDIAKGGAIAMLINTLRKPFTEYESVSNREINIKKASQALNLNSNQGRALIEASKATQSNLPIEIMKGLTHMQYNTATGLSGLGILGINVESFKKLNKIEQTKTLIDSLKSKVKDTSIPEQVKQALYFNLLNDLGINREQFLAETGAGEKNGVDFTKSFFKSYDTNLQTISKTQRRGANMNAINEITNQRIAQGAKETQTQIRQVEQIHTLAKLYETGNQTMQKVEEGIQIIANGVNRMVDLLSGNKFFGLFGDYNKKATSNPISTALDIASKTLQGK